MRLRLLFLQTSTLISSAAAVRYTFYLFLLLIFLWGFLRAAINSYFLLLLQLVELIDCKFRAKDAWKWNGCVIWLHHIASYYFFTEGLWILTSCKMLLCIYAYILYIHCCYYVNFPNVWSIKFFLVINYCFITVNIYCWFSVFSAPVQSKEWVMNSTSWIIQTCIS